MTGAEAERKADAPVEASSPEGPDLSGKFNQNPPEVGFLELIAEDFRTHDRRLGEPGFWAVAVHRFGNLRMDVRSKILRAPLSVTYRAMHRTVNWVWGIDLLYSHQLGRRVRLWHHGGMLLGARKIGNDVHIRHNVTLGMARRDDPREAKPIIEDGVDIGTGAAILGDVRIGHDSVIGANTVVVRSFPPRSTLFGVPARPVHISRRESDE
jgi:serine O-acetyltransferase